MKLQPNLSHINKERTIEQPYQMSVNRVFEVLSVRDKATLSEYSTEMDHRDVFKNIEKNSSNKDEILQRKILIEKEDYDLRLSGAALCVNTDLKVFWYLLSQKKDSNEIDIYDFCESMKLRDPRNKNTHKMIIESFYRLSNNIMTIAAKTYSATFQLISYKKDKDMIKYSFSEEFLKLINSNIGLERHNISTLEGLRFGVSKLLYTMLVRNKYKKDGTRDFKFNELAEYLGIANKKKGKAKEAIKKSLQELKDNNIIEDFYMKLDDIRIYSIFSNKKPDVKKEEDKKEEIKGSSENNIKDFWNAYDDNNISDCLKSQ